MLSEQAIKQLSSRRNSILVPVMAGAYLAVLLYLHLMGGFRERLTAWAVRQFGDLADDIAGTVLLILPAFIVFLLPSCLAAWYAGRFKTLCPACQHDLSSYTKRILATRCCPRCNQRIVSDGRVHTAAAYRRFQQRRSRHFVEAWLWAWPAIGGAILLCWAVDRSAFSECPGCLWLPSLIGATTAGWTLLRTHNPRVVPQTLASAGLLVLGAILFCMEVAS